MRKPETIHSTPRRPLCPVCGKVSYSSSGTHPQCAVTRADAVLRAAAKARVAAAPKQPARQQWSKKCPKCSCQIPSRRAVCDCGHDFSQSVKK